jgi:hypothetical protein
MLLPSHDPEEPVAARFASITRLEKYELVYLYSIMAERRNSAR